MIDKLRTLILSKEPHGEEKMKEKKGKGVNINIEDDTESQNESDAEDDHFEKY